ncbi:uncharacterized protein TNIN_493631, partial [Trichonephila inaurata madagascariensis]
VLKKIKHKNEWLQLEERNSNYHEKIRYDRNTRITRSSLPFQVPAISAYDLPDLTRLDYKDLGVRAEDLIESCEFVDAAGTPVVCAQEAKWVAVFDSMGLPNNCYAINSLIGNVSMEPYTTVSKSCK